MLFVFIARFLTTLLKYLATLNVLAPTCAVSYFNKRKIIVIRLSYNHSFLELTQIINIIVGESEKKKNLCECHNKAPFTHASAQLKLHAAHHFRVAAFPAAGPLGLSEVRKWPPERGNAASRTEEKPVWIGSRGRTGGEADGERRVKLLTGSDAGSEMSVQNPAAKPHPVSSPSSSLPKLSMLITHYHPHVNRC